MKIHQLNTIVLLNYFRTLLKVLYDIDFGPPYYLLHYRKSNPQAQKRPIASNHVSKMLISKSPRDKKITAID